MGRWKAHRPICTTACPSSAKTILSGLIYRPLRKTHKNPSLMKIYEEYWETPGSHTAHEVLHTGCRKLGRFKG